MPQLSPVSAADSPDDIGELSHENQDGRLFISHHTSRLVRHAHGAWLRKRGIQTTSASSGQVGHQIIDLAEASGPNQGTGHIVIEPRAGDAEKGGDSPATAGNTQGDTVFADTVAFLSSTLDGSTVDIAV